MNGGLIQFARGFHATSASAKAKISVVEPVHHLVKYKKWHLKPSMAPFLIPKNSPESHRYRPATTRQDRILEHYNNTIASDLLLITHKHESTNKLGVKTREWSGESPYHINRPAKPPRGNRLVPTQDIKVRTNKNLPVIEKVTVETYDKTCVHAAENYIPVKVMLQQITSTKPTLIYAKKNIPTWNLRRGMVMGAKVELGGRAMTDFLSTLSLIVLPRIKEFKGIKNTSGDGSGNISLGLTAEDIRHFPEIEANGEVWNKLSGCNIIIHTSAQVDPDARTLISGLNLPFTGKEKIPSRV
ncbi:mitochondrial ribosomal protein of the large subunit [Nadsonia fulvescens var. elongata DSM 6958]|uniref:Mitochondrial ribosomal protein of the large subunit n=1 Tax=Nadsonia fulvescens var. elongata DSM 6958 TaxID=857566 RepID=A0A1E3PRK8_9ASCO|nr:mitochondrial ribosomal protein of the large subunit [Nadsonia fulvescens var. elongata DSM 6958]